ncbi:MAG: threonylcarbamoyl-AMP synthase [Ruminococcaceae bacterium]|nr:threonylcarbamoyl-AMP synthase [Oscillospiraceae bacterium]
MKTEILSDRSETELRRAAQLLAENKLVAFPTETVYGLGANALNGDAVKRIFEAKGRPQDNPLIVHLESPQKAEALAYTSELYYKLAAAFMPGPITVIIPKKDVLPEAVTAGLDSVGIRVPLYAPARELIRIASVPIAAPSANISGKPSPTKAEHVIADMDGRIEAILCGDDCKVGVESTVVKITGEDSLVICRPGGVTEEMLKAVCGNVTIDPAVLSKFDGKPVSPGMKYRHYAPEASVEILVGSEEMVERFLSDKTDFAVICYSGDKKLQKNKNVLILGDENDSQEQASKLFSCLRECDKDKSIKNIYARMPKKSGVGLAVYNRLIKAAGFKITELK